MKIRNMKQVTERVKGLKGRNIPAQSDHYHYAGSDDRGSGVSELCGKKGSGGRQPVVSGRKSGTFRGRPDGRKSGSSVRDCFGHFKSGQ